MHPGSLLPAENCFARVFDPAIFISCLRVETSEYIFKLAWIFTRDPDPTSPFKPMPKPHESDMRSKLRAVPTQY